MSELDYLPMLDSCQFIEWLNVPIVLMVPSEAVEVQTWEFARFVNITSDSLAMKRNITVAPLTAQEIADVRSSKQEMTNGESKSFDNIGDAFSWLDAD